MTHRKRSPATSTAVTLFASSASSLYTKKRKCSIVPPVAISTAPKLSPLILQKTISPCNWHAKKSNSAKITNFAPIMINPSASSVKQTKNTSASNALPNTQATILSSRIKVFFPPKKWSALKFLKETTKEKPSSIFLINSPLSSKN